MRADPNRRADIHVHPYGCIAHQKIGWVGADLCVCQVGSNWVARTNLFVREELRVDRAQKTELKVGITYQFLEPHT